MASVLCMHLIRSKTARLAQVWVVSMIAWRCSHPSAALHGTLQQDDTEVHQPLWGREGKSPVQRKTGIAFTAAPRYQSPTSIYNAHNRIRIAGAAN